MAEQKNPYGYGDVDKVMAEQSGTGRYLSFRKGDKGRTIQIRLTGEPNYVNQHWITDTTGKQSPVNCGGETCVYCNKSIPVNERLKKVAKWGWIVIDREDREVKVFTGPTLIARAVKDLSELKDKQGNVIWGDPTKYDFLIERTEEPGANYYKVTPLPATKGDITEIEKKKVIEANFNLLEEIKGSKKSDNTGNYGASKNMETAPDEAVNPEDIPDNLGEEGETGSGDSTPF